MLPERLLTPHVAQATHYLFHLAIRKIKTLHPDGNSIVCHSKGSRASTTGGWCKYDPRTQKSTVALSPWCVMGQRRLEDMDHLLNVTLNIAGHEYAHGVIYKRFVVEEYRRYRCIVPPHGKEWQQVMRKELQVYGQTDRFSSLHPPLILCEGSFWLSMVNMFYDWSQGAGWDSEQVNALLQNPTKQTRLETAL